MKLLLGHVSPETAYVVDDYPYGFKLRCKIRYWIEFKQGKGYRMMTQTSNPKASILMWNKPKAGVYYTYEALYLDEKEHVHGAAIYAGSPGTWFRFYSRGFYHQLPIEERKKLDAILAWSLKINPSSAKRRDDVIAALNSLYPDNRSATPEELKKLAGKTSEYDKEVDDIYDCWDYDRRRNELLEILKKTT